MKVSVMPDGRLSLPAGLRKRHGLAQGGEVIVKGAGDASVLRTPLVGAVNLAEIVSHYAKLGASRSDIEAMLTPLPVRVVPVDIALSYKAGMLRPLTLPGSLSLGDRFCLGLARREQVPAMTAERRWPDIAGVAGVKDELIR